MISWKRCRWTLDSDTVEALVAEKPVGEDYDPSPVMRRLLREMLSMVEDPHAGVELLREVEARFEMIAKQEICFPGSFRDYKSYRHF